MKIARILKGAGIRSSYGTMGASASTLIEDGDDRILVDVGHFGNRDNLIANLKVSGLSPSDIDVVVLTHLNWDHCLNVDLFDSAKIILGEEELKNGTLSGVKDGISDKFKEILRGMDLTLIKEDHRLSENVQIITTPGHTPGHISVLVIDGSKKIVIAGDAVPNLRAYDRGVPDLIFYNLEQAKKSIAKIKDLKPDVIYPGHDPPFCANGYLERDAVDIILRNRDETNTVMDIYMKPAEKPVVFHE
ncbi:MBL fold metallo-hydrolase [Thermoplasma sp.]|uniref:MBL fold metallo-hydrolase n=1 Tax=Thermoplasma sp. TaxID=1973142 RepID=UPI002633C00F|nr:MBL fold metallo-hydrolase [Thermoplasma sp.]